MSHTSYFHVQQAVTEAALNNSLAQMGLASFQRQDAFFKLGSWCPGVRTGKIQRVSEVIRTVTFSGQHIFRLQKSPTLLTPI